MVCLFATEAIENIIGMYLCKYMQIAEVPSFIAHAQSYMISNQASFEPQFTMTWAFHFFSLNAIEIVKITT